MEELKRAKQKREDIKKEFEPVFEEENKQMEEVERVTCMNYEEAVERYDIGVIVKVSKELEEHYKRLARGKEHHRKMHSDKKYQEIYKKTVSSKFKKEYEKTVQKNTAIIINSAQKLTGMKTLNDLL